MAQVDVKWPSEDEEFDTTTGDNGTEATKVDVVDQSEETTPTDTPQESSEEAETSTESAEPETAPEVPAESATTEVSAVEEPTPEESEAPAEESEPEQPEAQETPSEPEDTPEESTPEPEVEAAAEPAEPEAPAPEETAAPEPETPAETPEVEAPEAPEPGTSIAPEAPSEPVSVPEPAAVSNTAPESEKSQAAPKTGGAIHHYGRDILIFALVLVVAGLGLWSWTLYTDKQNLQEQLTSVKNDPQAEISRQSKALIATVSKLTTLPKTEEPTIQTVTDAKLAKQQADFYAKAENGDKVLLYVNSRKAFLYRPSTNKLITVAPIQLDSNAQSNTASTTTRN